MKDILIAVERVGAEDTNAQDERIVEIVRELADENIVHVYASSVVLNEYGEYLRAKGIELHTQGGTSVADMQNEFDVIIAFDIWGIKNSRQFQAPKKIRVQEDSTLMSLVSEINKKEEKKEVEDEDEEKIQKPKPKAKPKAKPATKPKK
jgi:hypothetical protein